MNGNFLMRTDTLIFKYFRENLIGVFKIKKAVRNNLTANFTSIKALLYFEADNQIHFLI